MEPQKSILKEFISEGWIITVIGAGGMLARIMSSKKKYSILEKFKNICSAALASSIAWFVLEQSNLFSFYKAITYGIIGVISPEIINGVIVMAKKFEKNPEKFINKEQVDKFRKIE